MSIVYVLIGSVGAGKSTMAGKLNAQNGAQIISADEIYKTLPVKKFSTKPYDYKIRNIILNTICCELEHCLTHKQDCVIDYTNMPTKRRKKFLTLAKRHKAKIVCELLLVDKQTLINQLNKREAENLSSHKILEKEKSVDLYLKRLKQSKPTLVEGFDVINTYFNGQMQQTKTKHNKKRYLKPIKTTQKNHQ